MSESGWVLRRLTAGVALMAVVGLLPACGGGGDGAAAADAGGDGGTTLNLGYFPNVTHATALVGHGAGIFAEALGPHVELVTHAFNAGPEATEALFAEAIDATFIGPNPAINAYAQSAGEAIRIVSGATSGGAFLVVRDGIDDIEDLRGTTLATPQLGNTQDVALRAWLDEGGLTADEAGGGDVAIQPQANGDSLAAFLAGEIDGAWVPEPWATRMIQEGDGTVLVDERDLWPDGEYVTTHLIVRTEYLTANPGVIKDLLSGVVEATDLVNSDPETAKGLVNTGIEEMTGEGIPDGVLDAALKNLHFTTDPIASSLAASKDDAVSVGLLEDVDLEGIYDLELLNGILTEAGQEPVAGL